MKSCGNSLKKERVALESVLLCKMTLFPTLKSAPELQCVGKNFFSIDVIVSVTLCFSLFQIPVTQYASHCSVRLKRIARTGAKRGLRKPSVDDIQQAKVVTYLFTYFTLKIMQQRYYDSRLPQTANVILKLRISQNGKNADKDSPERFLWLTLE